MLTQLDITHFLASLVPQTGKGEVGKPDVQITDPGVQIDGAVLCDLVVLVE